MAKKLIPGIGWIEVPDGTSGAGPTSTDSQNPTVTHTTRGTAEQYGSPAWVAANFPEYTGVETSVKHTSGGGPANSQGQRRPSVTRTVPRGNSVQRLVAPWESLGFRELWESTPPDQRGALADSINFYRNGGRDAQGNSSIDPVTFNGLQYQGEDKYGRNIFSSDRGTLVGDAIPRKYNEDDPSSKGREYGTNAQWMGADGSSFQTKYYHHVQKDFSPDARYSVTGVYVPAYNNTRAYLGLQKNIYTTGVHAYPELAGLEPGTNIYGSFGFMWDDDVKRRRNALKADKPRRPGGGGGSGGGGGGGGGGGNFPPGSGGTQPNPPGGIPPRNPWDETPISRPPPGPVDYGPAPFNPYPGGDPYGGNGYQGYGHEAGPYERPTFGQGQGSQWGNLYQNFLNSGVDVSQYAPETRSAPAPAAAPPTSGSAPQTQQAAPTDWAAQYNRFVTGGIR